MTSSHGFCCFFWVVQLPTIPQYSPMFVVTQQCLNPSVHEILQIVLFIFSPKPLFERREWNGMERNKENYFKIFFHSLVQEFNGGNKKFIPLFWSLSGREWSGKEETFIPLYSLKTSNFHFPQNLEEMKLELMNFLLSPCLGGGNVMEWKGMKIIILEYSSLLFFGSFNGGNKKFISLFESLSGRELNRQYGILIPLYSLKTSNFHSSRNWEEWEGIRGGNFCPTCGYLAQPDPNGPDFTWSD